MNGKWHDVMLLLVSTDVGVVVFILGVLVFGGIAERRRREDGT